MIVPEKAVPLEFPVQGIDVSCEYGRQPPGTTPAAVNVRGYEPTTDRQRGGSRPGVFRLVSGTVGGLASEVQHLALIVDPTTPGLLASFEADISPPGAIPDPSTNNAAGGSTDPDDPLVRNPNRTVRAGGSGIQPNRHRPTSQSQIAYIQNNTDSTGAANPISVVLPDPPDLGDLVVVLMYVVDQDVSTPGVTGVTNNLGDAFTNVGGPGYAAEQTFTDFFGSSTLTVSLSMWYRVVTGGASDQTIKATVSGPGAAGQVGISAFVYRGAASLGPLYDAKKVATLSTVSALSVGGLLLNGTAKELVVAAFVGDNGVGNPVTTMTPAANYNYRGELAGIATGFTGYLIDRVTASGVGPETASGTPKNVSTPVPANGYVGIAASFHR